MGIDESVDSLALEEYDYYEDVTKKRWIIFICYITLSFFILLGQY